MKRRGRPKGTTKPDAVKRKPISMRLSQEVLELMESHMERSQRHPAALNKTDFVERAIRYYARDVLGADPHADAVRAGSGAGAATLPRQDAPGAESGGRQGTPPLAGGQAEAGFEWLPEIVKEENDPAARPNEPEHRDFVDNVIASWKRERPQQAEELFASFAIFARIIRAAQFLEAAEEQAVNPHGVSSGEYRLLATLRRQGPPYCLSPKELVQSVLITPGGITKQVDRLEKLGLVYRDRDASDRRSVLVGLTERGMKLIADVNMSEREDGVYQRVKNALNPVERQALVWLLRKLVRTLEQSEIR